MSLLNNLHRSELSWEWFPTRNYHQTGSEKYSSFCDLVKIGTFSAAAHQTPQEERVKKKKKEISPKVVLQSHLCLCFICVLWGAILPVVNDLTLLPVSSVPMALRRERLQCPWCWGSSMHDLSTFQSCHNQHPAWVSLCSTSKSLRNTKPFIQPQDCGFALETLLLWGFFPSQGTSVGPDTSSPFPALLAPE